MGSPSRNVQYHPPRLSEDRLNLPQPHSPSLPTHCSGKSGMRPAGCDRSTHGGRRDHALLLTLYNTGARVSELIAVRRSHVRFGPTAVVQLFGKGRKQRAVPLWTRTSRCLRQWFDEEGEAAPDYAFRARRPPDEAGRHPSARSGLPASSRAMSEPGRQVRVAARRPPHHRDAPAPGRRRHGHHRAVARPRATRDHPSIRRGGPATQGRRPAKTRAARSTNAGFKADSSLLAFLGSL